MIHKEGYRITGILGLVLLIINITLAFLSQSNIPGLISILLSLLILIFVMRFFRIPRRTHQNEPGFLYSPADGKVVVIEETEENEYFKEKMIQVSVFMSVWNVHINWFPVESEVVFYKYHPGEYLLARHPKSSELNERNTTVIRTPNGTEVLLRQIAGFVARRIISYAKEGGKVKPGQEMGFIKFGSRVDIFLPAGTRILVKPGQVVRGMIDKIAEVH